MSAQRPATTGYACRGDYALFVDVTGFLTSSGSWTNVGGSLLRPWTVYHLILINGPFVVERALLRPLPARRTAGFDELPARLSKYGIFADLARSIAHQAGSSAIDC